MPSTITTALAVTRPFYFPLQSGRYEVKPGLFRFPHDFGNGQVDQQIFQFDNLFEAYRAVKLEARTERLGKYYCTERISDACRQQTSRFLIDKLTSQLPEYFELEQHGGSMQLHCRLSNEILIFDMAYKLLESGGQPANVPYRDSFDALANQLQDDLAIVQLDEHGRDYISALHLCFANHWAAEDKIGRSFITAHAPVPGMEDINRQADKLMHSLIHKGPFVRFAWGIATDTRLNHHPVAPGGISPQAWQGRAFDRDNPHLYLRVERQTLHGLPQVHAALFGIRTYFYDVAMLAYDPEYKEPLIRAIESMSEADLSYKGLLENKPAILDWLAGLG